MTGPDERAARQVPIWALPGELAVLEGWPPGKRTVRDWAADALLFVAAVLVWFIAYADQVADPDPTYAELVPDWMMAIDPWVGAGACVALWWRRRFPLFLAVGMVVALALSSTSYGAVLAAVLTLAIHRGWLPATLVTGAIVAQSVFFATQWQPPDMGFRGYLATVVVVSVLPLSWGLVVRFRRQVLVSLRRDAQRQREEQERRMNEARRAERQRIAWEMHDVLAHRISLLTVHAGALAFRTSQPGGRPPTAKEINEAVHVIRENAHQALVELGEVLAVLRADDTHDHATSPGSLDDVARADREASPTGGDARTVLPSLADLRELIDEARTAGQDVRLRSDLDELAPAADGETPEPPPGSPGEAGASAAAPRSPASLRAQEQRTVYRVVQEGLTNARKHAPGAPVDVRVTGSPATGLAIEVTNPMPATATTPDAPGAEAGLAGLRERVEVDGGTLHHGEVDGVFRLAAELPWRR